MGDYINFNGTIFREDERVFKASSRAARFGDGLFETMRIRNGKILFEPMHEDRLFHGLQLMRFVLPPFLDWAFIRSAIFEIIKKNGHDHHVRVRLMVTRGDGGIMDEPINTPQFLVESWNVNDYRFDEPGLKVDVFRDCPRVRSAYSNIKTCNFLPSVMATMYAKENGCDECLLVNDAGRICDATISNVFWAKGGRLYTTPLSEGGIAGVMRSHLLKILQQEGISVIETNAPKSELHAAEELFLTNVIRGIRWVKSFEDTRYKNDLIRRVFELLIASLA